MTLLHILRKPTFFVLAFFILNTELRSQSLKPIAQLVANAKKSKEFKSVKPFSTLSERSLDTEKKFSKYLKEESIIQLKTEGVSTLYNSTSEALSLSLPFKNQTLELELVEQKNLWENFKVRTNDSKNTSFNYQNGKFYRGIVKGDNESIVSVSVFNNELSAQVSSPSLGNVVLNKINGDEKDNRYLIYTDHDLLIHGEFTCGTGDDEHVKMTKPMLSTRSLENKWVKMYFECDYDLYVNKGSSVTNVVNYVTSAFNNVATIYANEGINMAISEIFVWTSASPYSRTSSAQALGEFATTGKPVNGDLAQLLTFGGNARGGIAYVGSLCYNSIKYSYANINDTYAEFPTYSWTIMVMAHEIGHNLGSLHTQSCSWPGGPIDNCVKPEGTCTPGPAPVNGGTVMSYCMGSTYGVKFANGFGPLPGDVIRQFVTDATCLGTSPTCNAPTNLAVSDITCSSANISWKASTGAISYKVEYKTWNDINWLSVTATSSSIILKNLQALQNYQVRISTICSDGTSGSSNELGFETPNNTVCSITQTPTITNITSTTATVGWENVPCATGYNFDIRALPGSTWKTEKLTTNEKALTGLTAGKSYEIRVTAICSDVIGTISTTVGFSTTSDAKGNDSNTNTSCPTPSAPSVTNVTKNGAGVSWKKLANVTGYVLEYKKVDDINWVKYSTNSTSIDLSGLNAGSTYNTRVSATCTTVAGNASGSTDFTTEQASVSCDITTPPSVASFSSKSATVSWDAVSGASYYIVEHKLGSANNWSSTKTTGTNLTIRNLKTEKNYQFRVTAICNFTKGNPSPITNFTITTKALVASNKSYSISPNPTNGLIKLQIDSENDGSVDVSVMDATGKTVIVKPNLTVYEGTQVNEIDLSTLTNGFYFIRIDDFENNDISVKKVLLIRR